MKKVLAQGAIAVGMAGALGGIWADWWFDRADAPDSALASLAGRGALPFFMGGMIVLAVGCVGLSRLLSRKGCYVAGAGLGASVPLAAIALALRMVVFPAEFADWVIMAVALLFTVFALGMMFLVAGVSRRVWV